MTAAQAAYEAAKRGHLRMWPRPGAGVITFDAAGAQVITEAPGPRTFEFKEWSDMTEAERWPWVAAANAVIDMYRSVHLEEISAVEAMATA